VTIRHALNLMRGRTRAAIRPIRGRSAPPARCDRDRGQAAERQRHICAGSNARSPTRQSDGCLADLERARPEPAGEPNGRRAVADAREHDLTQRAVPESAPESRPGRAA
jgi:hypothetical protein